MKIKDILFVIIIILLFGFLIFINQKQEFIKNDFENNIIKLKSRGDSLNMILNDAIFKQKEDSIKIDSFNLNDKKLISDINKLKIESQYNKSKLKLLSNDSVVVIFNNTYDNINNNRDSAIINIGKLKDVLLSNDDYITLKKVNIIKDSIIINLDNKCNFLQNNNNILNNKYQTSLKSFMLCNDELIENNKHFLNIYLENDKLKHKNNNKNKIIVFVCTGFIAFVTCTLLK